MKSGHACLCVLIFLNEFYDTNEFKIKNMKKHESYEHNFTKRKFEGEPLPGYIRVGVNPPPELAILTQSQDTGYSPLIVGDFDKEELEKILGKNVNSNSIVLDWNKFKSSNLPVDPDAPHQAVITAYFLGEQEP